MADEHGGGHGANAARNGGDGLDDGLDLVKLGVAGDCALAALGVDLLRIPVDGDIDHDLAGAHEVLGQGAQHAGCGHQDVCAAGDLGGVDRLGVADGDGGVLLHQHHGCGLAHDQGAADDHGALALAVDAVVVQDLHAGLGGAGREAQILAVLKHACVGQVGHAVHILGRIQLVADLVLIRLQVLGQGAEHQHAVDAVVGVELLDLGDQGLLGHVLGQHELLHLNADQLRAGHSALLVGQVGRVLAAAENAQLRGDALFLQFCNLRLQLRVQCGGDFLAQQ